MTAAAPQRLVCVDAGLLVRVLTGEASPATVVMWRSWRASAQRMIAPSLVHFEVANALHKYTRSGLLSEETVDRAMALLFRLPMETVDDDDLHQEALTSARRFGIASVCDAHYLALAERSGWASSWSPRTRQCTNECPPQHRGSS